MRLLPLILLLASCAPDTPDKPAGRSLYAGEGRDRLCVAGEKVGFIVYGEAGANCSVRGRIHRAAEQWSIVPDGDEDCRIAADEQADTIRLGKLTAACAYYCGPGADFSAKAFTKGASVSPAVDFAGDPLC